MFGIYLCLALWLLQFLFSLGLIFFSNLGLYLRIGFSDFPLAFFVLSDIPRVEHRSFVRIFNDVWIFFTGDQILESHHSIVVEHLSLINYKDQQLPSNLEVKTNIRNHLPFVEFKNFNKFAFLSHQQNLMNRFTSSLIIPPDRISQHIRQQKHSRQNSIKSNQQNYNRKNKPVTSFYDKMLTQTTTSKHKLSQQLSPKRSRSNSKKSKADNHKSIPEVKALKATRKGHSTQQKIHMAQSLNIPHIQPYQCEQFIPNNSQQLSTHMMQQSLWVPCFSDLLARTQKVCDKYEKTCKSMEKYKREVERELRLAKAHIVQLQDKLAKRKNQYN